MTEQIILNSLNELGRVLNGLITSLQAKQPCVKQSFAKIWPLPLTTCHSSLWFSFLDNYDSFTYNLVQYIGELGERGRTFAATIKSRSTKSKRCIPAASSISPGPCTPQEAGISIDVIRHFAGKVPLLGVCLGHQAIGAAFGGNVVRAPNLMHGKTSSVEHDGKSIFRDIPSPMTATRYHSLIVAEKEPARRTGDLGHLP